MQQKPLIRFLIILFSCLFSISSEPLDDTYYNSLILKASNLKLYEERFWKLLLHYEKRNFRSDFISESNDKNFFFAPDGRTNPEKEMHATLKSFFLTDISKEPTEMHPQCKFPARYKWLKEKLAFDSKFLPEWKCERFEIWKSSLNPKSIKVIFASYYMGAPASVYGHTLMKIDTARDEKQELLDYGVNYAAVQNPDDNALQYAINGLFGFYNGQFAIFPYYFKVNEYNEGESRDLWEYKVNLNENEIEWFHLHLWELGGTKFPYYFFSDNCSYHILSLLEVARPSLRLREKVPPWVIPSETIKVIAAEKDFVIEKSYRPSLHSKIKQKLLNLNEEDRQIIYGILKRDIDPTEFQKLNLPVEKKALILDGLLDTFRFRKANDNQGDKEDELYRKFLIIRSELPPQNENPEAKQITTPPESGHSILRFKSGLGYSTNGGFLELAFRPAHHDLLNQDSGFVPNSENIILNFRVRNYIEQKKLFIEETNLLKLVSYSPYNSISKLFSYQFNIGSDAAVLKTNKTFLKDTEFKRRTMGNIEAVYGYTFQNEYSPFLSKFIFSILGGIKVQGSNELEFGYRAAPQALINLIGDFGKIKFVLSSAYYGYSALFGKDDYKNSFHIRYSLGLNHELRMELFSQRYYNEAALSYSYLF